MDRTRVKKRKTEGLTLIELLVAISISALLGGTVVLMLRTSLDTYVFSEGQTLIQKTLDDTLEEISGEGFRMSGVKDALEIIEAKENSISFVPLWVDDSQRIISKEQKLALNRQFRLGSGIPILEFRADPKDGFAPVPVSFIPHQEIDGSTTKDLVIPGSPLPAGSEARIIFQPDPQNYPDVVLHLEWDPKKGRLLRTYKNKSDLIPKNTQEGFRLTNIRFEYFDNTNTEIPSPVSEDLLPVISSVKVSLFLESKNEPKPFVATSFISLRNAYSFGKGIIIREGMRLKIPDSHRIRTFSLGNIVGVKDADVIELKAQPAQGDAWRIKLELGIKDNLPTIKKYSIDYPLGMTVYSEAINLTCDMQFNFLAIGANGRFDYDFDEDVQNAVDLKGDVTLSVEKMTPKGAAIFIRP